MIIGIDDTDSKTLGMCTTYLGALLTERLTPLSSRLTPYLVRLNPNVVFRTRGNAAVALRVELKPGVDEQEVRDICLALVEEFSVFSDDNTNPGVIFLPDTQTMGRVLERFSLKAVQDFIPITKAKTLLERYHIPHRGYKNGRGLIGALAAAGIASTTLKDMTYERIAYRQRCNWGKPRLVRDESIWQADAATYPHTWDTVDHHNGRIVCIPHGPDPVLFGIRGDSREAVNHAFQLIRSEPIERTLTYITNQGTDMHIIHHAKIAQAREGCSYSLTGTITTPPRTLHGGHVIFTLSDETGSLDCAAFEPTKNFRGLIRQLASGDVVTVYGSLKNHTVNIEKICIRQLAPRIIRRNPLCSECGRRMESAGRGQGYRCRRCRTTETAPEETAARAGIEPGYYETPPVARRHLSKPLVRCNTSARVHPSR